MPHGAAHIWPASWVEEASENVIHKEEHDSTLEDQLSVYGDVDLPVEKAFLLAG